MFRLTTTIQERFEARYVPCPMSGCWLWIGGDNGKGYGVFSFNRKNFLAHRVSYQLAKGMIPEGLQIDHLCRNRSCVNPAHLEAVTMTENIRRSECPPAKNARQTHCKRGHQLPTREEIEATSKAVRMVRNCKQCRLIHYYEYRAQGKKASGPSGKRKPKEHP